MDNSIHDTISILREQATSFTNFGTDFFLLKINDQNVNTFIPGHLRVDGACIIFCTGGSCSFTVNFEPCRLGKGSVNVVGFGDCTENFGSATPDFECYALFLTPAFIQKFNIDLNAIDYRNFGNTSRGQFQLNDTRSELLLEHFRMLFLSTRANAHENVFTRNIARSLISALIYQLMEFQDAAPRVDDDTERYTRPGNNAYVNDFMTLLHDNFRTRHSVNYYASRLFISPKYLSLILKEATGMTAGEWIDRLLVIEAKNLLRYSGKNIQQIAYELHFNNQSAFGKYFKNRTGHSPSAFRKT